MPKIAPVLSLVVPLLAGACGSKVSECNALVDRMNARSQELDASRHALVQARPADVTAEANALRATVDAADDELAAFEPRDATLRDMRDEYRGLLTQVRASAADLAQARLDDDRGALVRAALAADAALTTERDLVEHVNSYCSP